MKCIIYVSKPVIQFESSHLTDLCIAAEEKNHTLGVTGYLCFRKNRFMQYIEGESTAVSNLMKVIENDERHTVLYQLTDTELDARRFPYWSMKYIRDEELVDSSFEKIVDQYLGYVSSDIGNKENWMALLWKTVDSLAASHGRLTSKMLGEEADSMM